MPPPLRPVLSVPSSREPADTVSDRMRVVAWPDPVIDKLGYDPRSLYVEKFWLGILGPTSTWWLRRIAAAFDEHPDGFDFDVDVMARSLGLGGRAGRHSPFQRAITRCVRFGVARHVDSSKMAVRRRIPPLPRRHLVQLPPPLQESHRVWTLAAQRGPTLDETRRRARRLAVHLLEAGEAAAVVELELIRYRVHPAVAHEATVWATKAVGEVAGDAVGGAAGDAVGDGVDDASRSTTVVTPDLRAGIGNRPRASDASPSPDRRRLVEVPPPSGS